MSLKKRLKEAFILPFRRTVPTLQVGTYESWNIVDPGKEALFVISAGVGRYVTFEKALTDRWHVEMILVDPSPTGRQTMKEMGDVRGISYQAVGLAAEDGVSRFARPIDESEGSFFMASEGVASEDMIDFQCKSLNTLMKEANRTEIDVLKLDIEGAEYSVIDRFLAERLVIKQLCVEIHTRHRSGADVGLLAAAGLIFRLYRAGYRVVFNNAMDFTFTHKSLLKGAGRRAL